MPGLPDALVTATILLLAALVASYLLGREQKERLLRSQAGWLWLALGRHYAEPRLAATGYGFTATAQSLEGPARRIDVSLFLLPREIPPLWLARAVGGATDLLTFWVSLRALLISEGDVIDVSALVGRREARLLPSTWVQRRDRGLILAAPTEPHLDRLHQLAGSLRQTGFAPVLALVRSQAPHLQITFRAPATPEECQAAVRAVLLAVLAVSDGHLPDSRALSGRQ
ncbi:hypothetical protein HRbin26_00428 [bacterium HR26]|nr:hypothetical protein HRbin26_00428 [bacterium HR26]